MAEAVKKKGFMDSNLAFVGIVAGAVFTLASITKYYVFMNDYDRLIAYATLGLLIMFASWGHERSVRTDNKLEAEVNKINLNIIALEDWTDEHSQESKL